MGAPGGGATRIKCTARKISSPLAQLDETMQGWRGICIDREKYCSLTKNSLEELTPAAKYSDNFPTLDYRLEHHVEMKQQTDRWVLQVMPTCCNVNTVCIFHLQSYHEKSILRARGL